MTEYLLKTEAGPIAFFKVPPQLPMEDLTNMVRSKIELESNTPVILNMGLPHVKNNVIMFNYMTDALTTHQAILTPSK